MLLDLSKAHFRKPLVIRGVVKPHNLRRTDIQAHPDNRHNAVLSLLVFLLAGIPLETHTSNEHRYSASVQSSSKPTRTTVVLFNAAVSTTLVTQRCVMNIYSCLIQNGKHTESAIRLNFLPLQYTTPGLNEEHHPDPSHRQPPYGRPPQQECPPQHHYVNSLIFVMDGRWKHNFYIKVT